MLLFLKIAGIVALVLVIGVVLAIRWFLRQVRTFAEASQTVPCRIRPEPEPNPRWRNAEVVQRLAGEFRALGFADIGAFSIPEMGSLQFLAFTHEREQFYGCVYDHPKLGPTFDVVCRCANDTAVTGTNTRMGEALDQRPGRLAIRLDGGTVAEVFEAVRSHPSAASPRVPATAEDFLTYFRQAHAEFMNWRLARGGTTRDEIRRQAAQDGQEVDNEVIEETYQSMRESYVEQLREACLAQYLDEAKVPAAEWEHRESSLLAIPETLDRKELIETLEMVLTLDDEQRHQLNQLEASFGQNAVDLVGAILERDLGALGLKKLAEVREPVRAWILELPKAPEASGGADPSEPGPKILAA